MIEDNLVLINRTQVNRWLKNNNGSTKFKAMTLYKEGIDFEYITKKLNLNKNQFCRWIMEFHDYEAPKFATPKNKHLKSPQNYSSWISDKIYENWNRTAVNKVKNV
jgi:hypothetical protein